MWAHDRGTGNMKRLIYCCVAILIVTTATLSAAENTPLQFLRYIYGADDVDITKVCHPTDDVWMLRGAKNTNVLAQLKTHKFYPGQTNIISGTLQTDLYFIELRDGKVDPAFNLDGVYNMHRRLVLTFIYSALSGNEDLLKRITTEPKKVQMLSSGDVPGGDMDQYASIIEMLPVVRSSKPSDDAKTKSITYRVPIHDPAFMVTLVKDGSTWKIDSSKGIRVPLSFFFR